MQIITTHQEHEDFLSYEISGDITYTDMIRLADCIHDDAATFNKSYALIDCSGIIGRLELVELYKVAEYFAKRVNDVWLGAVNTPEEWTDNSFSEDVIYNRSGHLYHFKTHSEALNAIRSGSDQNKLLKNWKKNA